MTRFELFTEEQAIVHSVSESLKDQDLRPEQMRTLLSALLDKYKKLLRQTEVLVKLSDDNAMKLHQLNDQLRRHSENLEYTASHDALTGLLNKGAITRIVQQQLAAGDFILILFDIDHFKKVNDTYGHYIGDRVLSEVAKLVEENLRPKDYAGRFGGEEFIIVLNETSHASALAIAQDLLRLIGNAVLVEEDDMRVKVTVSMGLTAVTRHESFEEIYTRADRLLYAAKQNGRNRIECDAAP
jgi:diguanylate cyclase (GGDEF)-like protein